MLPHIYKLTQIINTLHKTTKKKSNPNKKLHIISNKTLLSYQIPQILQHFQQHTPKIHLSLQSLNYYIIHNTLLNNKTNINIFYHIKNNNTLNQQKLNKQSLILITSPQITNINFTKPKKHNTYNFIINKPQYIFQQIFKNTLHQQQITIKNTIKLINIKNIKHYITTNIKINYLPHFTITKKLKYKKLIKLPFNKQSQTITTIYTHHTKKTINPTIHTFIQYIKKNFITK